jgi:CheY-like chemotaxis protein
MNRMKKTVTILIADDDQEDREMIQDALKSSRLLNSIQCVGDGVELLDYLEHRGRFTDQLLYPSPGLILLDLNMPRLDGREALREIKNNLHLRQIPVIILTTSKTEEDIFKTYDLGVNSFITKPVSFEALVNIMKTLGQYWFEIVELPVAAE